MEKIEFKNKLFEYSLIGLLILLLCWNLYALTLEGFKALIPILIQGTLLFLILSKNKQAKIGIKIWSIILILSYGISFFIKSFEILLGDEIEINIIIKKGVYLIIGILIYSFNKKYVEIIKTK